MLGSNNSLLGWFQFLDADGDGKIGGAQVADFFKRSNLSVNTLRKVWELTAGKEVVMTEVQFLLAMSLISLAQFKGGSFHPEEAYSVIAGIAPELPLPKIRGFTEEEWVFSKAKPASIPSQDGKFKVAKQPGFDWAFQADKPTAAASEKASTNASMTTSEPRTNIQLDSCSSLDSQRHIPEKLQHSVYHGVERLSLIDGGGMSLRGKRQLYLSGESPSPRIVGKDGAATTPTKQTNISRIMQCSGCLQTYSVEDLRKATNGYATCLGGGGYGEVYKGSLSHIPVAVKILGADVMQGAAEYEQEVLLLGKMRHPHIVTLYGKCDGNGALVYELLSGGSLEDKMETTSLHWETKLRIAKEVALGLVYMHDYNPPIVHRDLKPANVLLDQHLTAKVGDMGLARKMDPNKKASTIAGGMKGTYHYMAPEYENTGVYTSACDVYSFGIIILQLITHLPPNIVRERVSETLESGTINQVLDNRIGAEGWPQDVVLEFMRLGAKCCSSRSENRPGMVEVVESLKELHGLSMAIKTSATSAHLDAIDRLLLCPLTRKRIQDPVVADDGCTYERRAIEEWLSRGHRISPVKNTPITSKLVPNLMVRSLMEWHSYARTL